MKITRSIAKDGGLLPTAVNFLGEIPEGLLFHDKWPSRHPLGIYQTSLGRLLETFRTVLEQYGAERQHFLATKKTGDYKRLLDAQRSHVYALREHVDDCSLVLRTLIDPTKHPARGHVVDPFLRQVPLPGFRKYQSGVGGFRDDYIGPIVNGLKHRNAQLRPIVLYGTLHQWASPGYYVEEPWGDGALGPSWLVHRDGNSGLSFSRDILFNFYSVYEISEELVRCVRVALQAWYGISPQERQRSDAVPGWDDLARAMAKVDYEPFPNEISWLMPMVEVVQRSGQDELTLDLRKRRPAHRYGGECKVHTGTTADGVSRTFKLPYFGTPKRKK